MKMSKKILSIFLSVVLLVPCIMQQNANASETTDIVEFNGNYYKLFDEGINWFDAKEACEKIGGHLITINSKEENDFITDLLKTSATRYCYWTAIMYDYELMNWVHYDGTAVEYQNWADNEPNDWKNKNEAFVHLYGKRFTGGIGIKEIGEWNDASSEGAGYAATIYALDQFGYVCEWDNEADEMEREKYLAGYDKFTDQYVFINQTQKIDKSFYQLMYQPLHSEFFYLKSDGTNGQCYGMATTAGMFLKNAPAVNEVTRKFNGEEEAAQYIVNMWNESFEDSSESYVNTFNLELSDFIKYAHITQFADFIVKQSRDTKNEYEEIIQAVKAYIDGGEPIVITVSNWFSPMDMRCHAILPIGYKETKESFIVYIDDSNYPQTKQELTFRYNNSHTKVIGWSYLDYGSDKFWGEISFSKPFNTVYNFCSNTKQFRNVNENYLSNSKLLILNEAGIKISNAENNEIIYDSVNKIENNIYEISVASGEDVNNKMYWIDKQFSEFGIKSETGDLEFTLADGFTGISAKVKEGDNVICCVEDNEELSVSFTDVKNEKLTFSFIIAGDDYVEKISISGNAFTENVSATQTESGFNISGMDNCDITLLKNDEAVVTKTVSGAISDVEIIYDSDSEDSIVDVIYETSKNDNDSDDSSDNSDNTDNSNCNHICHTEDRFLQFIWKLYNFLMKLFSMERYCSCGVAHY